MMLSIFCRMGVWVTLLLSCFVSNVSEGEVTFYDSSELLDIMVKMTGLIEAGQTMRESEFLDKAGIDRRRLGPESASQVNLVVIVERQISGDFNIVWMSNVGDDETEEKHIYGVRMVHRLSGKVIARSWTQ